ncbi:MBL fold metallo-hydrolase [Henriciella litoralis]|uniref:MBL fold metallo-hydrolase n=1 Tax=Henriciella litoralis TaxID=568102 RepID=UPI0009FFEDB9|nr:MBL fold metallo-hydrolase [Henriciella litoralis]
MFRSTISLAVLGLALSPAAFAHGDGTHTAQAASPTPVTTNDLGNGIYMLVGRGGNVGVLTGEDGTFVIDSQYAEMAPGLLSAINDIAGTSDVRFLLNTHWHGDHAGGNVPMADAGATIIGHDNVRARLSTQNSRALGGETQIIPPADEAAWPVLTYSDEMTLYLNGQTIHVHHLPNAHTDTDSAIYFEEANVIHTGDVMFNGSFPFVDVFSGGSFDGYLSGLDTIYSLADETTKIIPGHGPEATRDDVMALRDVVAGSVEAVQAEIDAGKTPEEIQAANPLAEWSDDWGSGFINADRFVSLIYADLTAPAQNSHSDKDHSMDHSGHDGDHAADHGDHH